MWPMQGLFSNEFCQDIYISISNRWNAGDWVLRMSVALLQQHLEWENLFGIQK